MKEPVTVGLRSLIWPAALLFLAVTVLSSQESQVLEEKKGFYSNYALESYSKEYIEEQLEEFYDLFGEYITNGFFLYSLDNQRDFVSTNRVSDSTVAATSNEHRDELFFENFRNILYTQDAIGGVKTAIVLGNQIRTHFSPLTFSKRHYEGVRWDLFYEGFDFTSLISRTRPGLTARSYEGGMGYSTEAQTRDSWVLYPFTGIDYTKNNANEEWNESTSDYVDFSARTAYGDYDFLWAFYAHKKVRENWDVALTYVNHHHSDVEKGEKWHGDLPDQLLPDEIHFEFYDNTYSNTNDPGVQLHDIQMTVVTTGGSYTTQPAAFYQTDGTYILPAAGTYPFTRDGMHPLICTFYPKDIPGIGNDTLGIKDIKFTMKVSGNYLVFVSTDKIGLLHNNHWTDGKYDQKQISEILYVDPDDTTQGRIPLVGDGSEKSDLYFGEYILRSPCLATSQGDNYIEYNYNYTIPAARTAYSVSIKGKAFNTDVEGEFTLNHKKSKMPSQAGNFSNKLNVATYWNLYHPLRDNLDLSARLFHMDADYRTSLEDWDVSRDLAWRWEEDAIGSRSPYYDTYPLVLSNGFETVDDNEDQDYYSENDLRTYPSGMRTNSGQGYFLDGYYKSPKMVGLPASDSTYSIPYDDQDGVIPERYDRNRNGTMDYQEDFLIYNADPPLFDLEIDRNNNSIPDNQEDDLYPDYPFPGAYIYTSNDVKSLGIQGMELEAHYKPVKNLQVTTGLDYLRALDANIDGESEALLSEEGKSLHAFGRAIYRVTRRDQGLGLFFGEELKYVKDGIRNDAVVTQPDPSDANNASYYIFADNLRFRNALVNNATASVNYLNIPNFEITARAALKGELHFADDEKMYITRGYWDPIQGRRRYESIVSDYDATTILGASLLLKMGYDYQLTHLPRYLQFLDKLTISPRVKVLWDYSGSGDPDPREDATFDDVRKFTSADSLWQEASQQWVIYDEYNEHAVYTIPMLRMSYPITDKTYLDFGWQWKRSFDKEVPERANHKQTRVLQLISRDNYISFNIAFQFGYKWVYTDYDLNTYHPVYRYGERFDKVNSQVFVKLLTSINN